MSFAKIQRRAFAIALGTMVIVAAAVLLYWQGVSKGVLPSPVQPMDGREPDVAPRRATVSARAPFRAPVTPTQPATMLSVNSSPPSHGAAAAHSVSVTNVVRTETAVPENTPAMQASRVMTEPQTRAAPATIIDPADEQMAGRWLSSTNQRPVLRVHYDPADILQLGRMGRGVLVATACTRAAGRELYLVSQPGTAPLFAPYTQSVADRFSSYSLILDISPELAPITAVFPAYFPGSTAVLTFVPDRALATQIFAEVAKAGRSTPNHASPVGHGTVFEGQLTLQGTEPGFQVRDVR